MNLKIIPYEKEYEMQWDSWCSNSYNATFLHTRKFINYHQDRFLDRSILIYENNKIVGLFPAAVCNDDSKLIISHPGLTYGGFLRNAEISGGKLIKVFEFIFLYFQKHGYKKIYYKSIPNIYHRTPSQDDIYALFRLNAKLIRVDLSCSINLKEKNLPSSRRIRSLKKALKVVTLCDGDSYFSKFWDILCKNLESKHQAKPVHSLDEILFLKSQFPEEIKLKVALINNQVEAGVLIFCVNNVWHSQYIASSQIGYDHSALDAVFDSLISSSLSIGMQYFDFGTSNESFGTILNDGLYTYKSEFGGGGIVHQHFEINLN